MSDAAVLELDLSDLLDDPSAAIEKAQKKLKAQRPGKRERGRRGERLDDTADPGSQPPGVVMESIVLHASGAPTPFSAELFMPDHSSCGLDVPEFSAVDGPEGGRLATSDALTATGWETGELYNMDHGRGSSRRTRGSRFLRLHRIEVAIAVITCVGAWLNLAAYICLNVVPRYRSVSVLVTAVVILVLAVVFTLAAAQTKTSRAICRSVIQPYLGVLLTKAGAGALVLVYACASYPVAWGTAVEIAGSSLSVLAMVAGAAGLLGSAAVSTTSRDYIRSLLGLKGAERGRGGDPRGSGMDAGPAAAAASPGSPETPQEAKREDSLARSPSALPGGEPGVDAPSPAGAEPPALPVLPPDTPDLPRGPTAVGAEDPGASSKSKRKQGGRGRRADSKPRAELSNPKTTL